MNKLLLIDHQKKEGFARVAKRIRLRKWENKKTAGIRLIAINPKTESL